MRCMLLASFGFAFPGVQKSFVVLRIVSDYGSGGIDGSGVIDGSSCIGVAM